MACIYGAEGIAARVFSFMTGVVKEAGSDTTYLHGQATLLIVREMNLNAPSEKTEFPSI